MRRLVAAGLTLAMALPATAAQQPSTHSGKSSAKSAGGSHLDGQVLGQDGKPISGAVVSVRSLDGDASWQSRPSDRRGRFRLEGLPYGWDDLVVTTAKGEFLGDQAINLPPGSRVALNFTLLDTADKPASWWTERRVEPPSGVLAEKVAGMAQSSQRLTGVEYWKSPAGIAILATVSVVALGLIAAGGGKYKAPTTPTVPTTP
jgi:Carboxypeptidase regulatory-like domain